jgi:hypothetical protein
MAYPSPGSVNVRVEGRSVWTGSKVGRSENKHLEGRTVGELAKELGKHPVDTVLDLAVEEDLKDRVQHAGHDQQPRGCRSSDPQTSALPGWRIRRWSVLPGNCPRRTASVQLKAEALTESWTRKGPACNTSSKSALGGEQSPHRRCLGDCRRNMLKRFLWLFSPNPQKQKIRDSRS